ncbi:MAG: hypothetical protein AAF357_17490 [Verrucomicrobiota bacterium]
MTSFRRLPLIGLLAICSAAVSQVAADSEEEEMFFWHFSYHEALKEAKATGKPIFLEFRCAP